MNGFKRSNGKFLVDTENVDFIIENIRAKVDDRSFAIPMERKKVTRIIYRMPYLKENESRWLRILIGDVDCHNKTGVTINYKVKNTTEGKEVKTPILKVEEFDQAVDFFEALGFQRTSTQENIRTKLYVTFENVKYMIRFDIWPLLDEVTFVTVEEVTPTDPRTKEAFIKLLNISKYDIYNGTIVDVDTTYKERLGFRASDISQLCFGLDIEEQYQESKELIEDGENPNLFYMWLSNEWEDAKRLFQAFKKSKRSLENAINLLLEN